jgi:glutaminyl-tRNA synthetase
VRALVKDGGDAGARITAAHLAELIAEIQGGSITATIAKEVLAESARSGEPPRAVIEKKGMRQIADTGALEGIAAAVLAENVDLVARYRAGNANLFGAIVGAAMRKTGGKANAKALQDALRKALG